MDNMHIYNAARSAPTNAIKPIKGGAYGAAGLSDINPQWRIERMTGIFGPCGVGWMWEPVEITIENGVCYGHVVVSYRTDEGWSKAIHGYGGTKIGSKDDSDLIKSTVTDAISNALRYLGIGADVWYKPDNTADKNQFDTKHSAPPQPASPEKPRTKMATVQQMEYIKQSADDETYMNAMSAFGPDLEHMTYNQALKLIDRINGGVASGQTV